MAKKEIAKAQVYLDGKQAETVIDNLKKESKELRKELKKAFEAGDTSEIDRLNKKIKANEQVVRSAKKATFDYEKVLKNINGASFNELNKALKTTQSQLKRLKQTDAGYKQKEEQVKQLRTQITKLNAKTRATTSIWSRMANGANKYMGMITAGAAAIAGIGFSTAQFIKGLTGLDDELANVQKTTGMARNEVRSLYGEFKKLNTRTKKSVLLEYAEEAGRLGKKGKKDVLEFVAVANKIGTALGDDLGNAPEAIREVGKLVNIYKIGNQYNVGFGESMEKIGSAINEVAANSSASAGYQIEYLKRLSGTAKQAKITADEILGYSSVLDQNGQAVEMAATAQSKLMIDMFTKPGEYAKIAKMEVKEFTQLLETDANEAFLKFLEGINGNNEGFITMAGRLDELGIKGARAVQVLTTMASNTDNIRKEQRLANIAMKEGISLTNEYNVKNNNLAGSWEKLTKHIKAKFINPQLIGFMEKLISRAAKLTEFTSVDALKKEQSAVNSLVIQLRSANIEEETREGLLIRLKELAPDVAESITDESTGIQGLSDTLETYNKNMALKILMAEKELSIENQRSGKGGVEAYMKLRAESEAELIKEMTNSVEWFKKKGSEYTDEVRKILVDNNLETVEKAAKINTLALRTTTLGNSRLYGALDSYRIFTEAYYNESRTLKQMIEDAEALVEQYKDILGVKKKIPDEDGGYGGSDGNGGDPPLKEIRSIKVINEEISALQKKQTELSNTSAVYQEYQKQIIALEKEKSLITGIDKEADAAKKKADADAKKKAKELEAERKKAAALLQEYETYLEKRHRLQAEYEKKRNDIIDAGGTVGNIAMINAEEQQKLEEIDQQIAEKQAGFEKWANQMTKMGLNSLTEALNKAQASLIAGTDSGASEEELAALRAKIEMMKAQVEAVKAETEAAGSSEQKWDETVRHMNEIHQNVQHIIDQFEDLDETTKLALASAMNISGGIIAMMTGIKSLSAMTAASIKSVEGASVILAIIGAAIQIAIAIANLVKSSHDKKYNKQIEESAKSVAVLENAYKNLEKVVKNSFGTAKQGAIEQQKENLKLQQQAIQMQIDAEKNKKKPDNDAIAQWEQTLSDLDGQIEDMPSLADTLFGEDIMSAVDNFANAWVDAWKSGEDIMLSQEDLLNQMIERMIVTLMSERLQEALDKVRDSISYALDPESDGGIRITEKEKAGIMTNWNSYINQGQEDWHALEDAGLITTYDEDGNVINQGLLSQDEVAQEESETGVSTSSSSSFSSMKQETADELNGRFTAIQASNEVIKIETIKFGDLMQDMKGLQLTIHATLEDIKDNTDYLPNMSDKLDKIEKHLKES